MTHNLVSLEEIDMNAKDSNHCEWNYNFKDIIIIYTDAAFSSSNGKAAFGYVVQKNGNVLLAGACSR